jgi:hypothetical protein
LYLQERQHNMRTLSSTDIRGFVPQAAVDQQSVWRVDRSSRRVNPIRSSSSRPISPGPQSPGLADDDFPFSALIRLVRAMRE